MPRPTDDQQRPVLSIDLGASCTKLAWRPKWKWEPGDGLSVEREYEDNVYTAQSSSISIDGGALIPSLVYESAYGSEWFFGHQAADKPMASAGKLHTNWKKQLYQAKDGSDELSDAMKAATGFLRWLRSGLEKEVPGLLSKAHTSVCVPKFSTGSTGLRRLAQAFESAGWMDRNLLRIYEPEANLIGLTANGRNRVRASRIDKPEPRLDYMFPETSRLFQAARDQAVNNAPSVKTCVIDIGAYTTDIAVCAVGTQLTLSYQESHDHGISKLDDHLCRLIERRGGRMEEIKTSEFELLKKDAYALRPFTLAQAGGLIIAGEQLESSIEAFAADLWSKIAAHVQGVRWAVLTGGGSLIRRLRERMVQFLREAGLEDIRRYFQDIDQRTATAHGGCSAYFLHGSSASSPASPPQIASDPDEIECSCQGNSDCIRCGGIGYRPRLLHQPRQGSPQQLPPQESPSPPTAPTVVPPQVTPVPSNRPPTEPRQSASVVTSTEPFEPTSASNVPERRSQQPLPPLDFGEVGKAWEAGAAKALSEFTLDGWMGSVVFPDGPEAAGSRRDVLLAPESPQGKAAWFRLFCLGASLGVRMQRTVLKPLWMRDMREVCATLVPGGLTEVGSNDFTQRTNAFFEEAIHRQFQNTNAGGEYAEIWRRVFYDFRKMHHYVYQNDLHGVLLKLLQLPSLPWTAAADFLKSGRHPDGRWRGVLGQSMTAPILFLMRELRRLQVIDQRFDASCFYMNNPARRVACRLGWISEAERVSYDFDSLVDLSQTCHRKMKTLVPDLIEHFDLPLQWFAFKESATTYFND